MNISNISNNKNAGERPTIDKSMLLNTSLNQSTLRISLNRLTTYKKLEYSRQNQSIRSIHNFRESLYETNKVEAHGYLADPFKEIPKDQIDLRDFKDINAGPMLNQSIINKQQLNTSINNNQLEIIEQKNDIEDPMENLLGAFYFTVSMFIYAVMLLIQKKMFIQYPNISFAQQNIFRGSVLAAINYIFQVKTGLGFYLVDDYTMNKYLAFRVIYAAIGEFILFVSTSYLRINTASIFTIIYAVVCSYVAAIILKEKVNSMDSTIIISSFLASCLIIKPFFGTGEDTFFGIVLGILSVGVNCICIIYHKFLDVRITNFLINFYVGICFLIQGVLCLALGDSPLVLDFKPTMIQIMLGLLFTLSRYFGVKGISMGKVSFVLTFQNTFIVFSMILGYYVLGESCDFLDILGATLLIGFSVFRSYLVMKDDKKIIEEVTKEIEESRIDGEKTIAA